LSTQFLTDLDADYARLAWYRRTAFFEHDTRVRLTLLAQTTEHLDRWRQRLAVPDDLPEYPPPPHVAAQ
jgi:hypothetical protein